MNASFRNGMVAGFILGAALMAFAALLLKPRHEVESPPAVAVATRTLEDDPLTVENKKLQARIDQLEKERDAAAKKKKEENPAQEPPPAAKETVDYHELFANLSELGLAAFGNPKFKAALEAIKAAGKPGIEFLTETLRKSKSASERFLAAALLEGAADPSSVDALALALKNDDDDIVRRMASHALATMGAASAETPLRAATAEDKDWGVRVNSAYGLAKLGKEDGLKILKDSYESADTPPEYRLAILGGLADVAAPSSAPLFRKILADTKDASYLLLSIGALEKMKDAESISALQAIVNSTQPEMVKQRAAKAIETIRK
ncbi:MAG TPA: HEAT repeat domain-containing protein [Planctomycetota bacterium]|jgi:HEAT repeat protein|nr:HEAT repeat domain-containing protein [Planctomycetota bacterium]